MKFAVVAKPDDAKSLNVSESVISYLEDNGYDYEVEWNLASSMGTIGTPLDQIDVNVIVVVGGDGTILLTLQKSRGKILGINTGLLGFLTEVSMDKWKYALEKTINGDYIIDRRMKLSVKVDNNGLPEATNEAVIHTSEISKMRHFKILAEGETIDIMRADGIIVATPTGSTCYAMSAGGPIIDPRVSGILIVPIAPFKISARAFVLDAECRTEIELSDEKKSIIVIDGQYTSELEGDERIVFKKSEMYAEFIRFGKHYFYDNFRQKIMKMEGC